MTGFMQDLRGAVRLFKRAPGFAAVVAVTLGIGVGGASAVYSVVNGVLLTPLAFEDADRVVMMWGQSSEYPRTPLTVGDHNVLATEVEAFTHVAAEWGNTSLILGEGEAEQVSVGWVTPDYFDLLGVIPALGRGLEAGSVNEVVISHALWVRRYGSDPATIGRVIDLSGERFEVVGVLPADADPNLTTFGGSRARHEVWRLQPPQWTQGDDRSVGWLRSTARLAPGTTLEAAQTEVDGLMTRVNQTITDRDGGTDLRINLIPARTDLVGSVSRTLWILLAAVGGVLLIAASNIAHLLLARGEVRSGEVAVRTALGGTRGRLIRQFLIESALLAAVGGVLGLVLASVGVRLLLGLAPPTLPRVDEITLDGGVFAFALLATLAASVVFAIVPAIRASRSDISQSLGERTVTSDPSRQKLSRALIVAEVALSFALVTSTGLLVRSFTSLQEVELGFEREGLLTFAVEAPDWGDSDAEAAVTMQAYLDAFTSVPGVTTAGFTNRVPLGGGLFTGTFRSGEMVAADQEPLQSSVRYVTPDYFEAMGARLLAGRTFRSDEGEDRVLIDERAAEAAWPGENPVGRQIELSALGADPMMAEVVGVVAPMKHHGVRDDAAETVFRPMFAAADRQNFRYGAVRVAGDAAAAIEPLRRAARTVDADAVVARVRTMQELFDQDVSATRFATLLLSIFGGVALLLATVGLHGVMAFSVRRRSREIGIRVVLGAEQNELLFAAVRSGAILILLGIGLGTLLSIGAGNVLSGLLYGVSALDPRTFVVAGGVILAVGLFGTWLPARLVLGVDPAVTLREE